MDTGINTLWGEAWPSSKIPAYPTYGHMLANGGEITYDILEKTPIGNDRYAIVPGKRIAMPGGRLRDEAFRLKLDYTKNIEYRKKIIESAKNDKKRQQALLEVCKSDILYFINTFVWITDQKKVGALIPFVTWPAQDEVIKWLLYLLTINEDADRDWETQYI